MENDTIVAIATAQGLGGIGIIKISGEEAIHIADKIFVSLNDKKLFNSKGYTAHYGYIINGDEYIDESIATVFLAPKSYTGEDVVEISCHGGLYITKTVLELTIKSGARLAGPGEFTKRAFLNGKIGLTEAEAVMDIIEAKSNASAKAAILAREGALFRRIEETKNLLINLTAKLSVCVDYPDEDIVNIDKNVILNTLDKVEKKLSDLSDTYNIGKIIREGIYTVIVGRPNVGKSTLMNLLAGCERSIVTKVPGTTRDVVEDTIVLGNIMIRLADTAGIHSTKDEVEVIGVNKAKKQIDSADLVFAVFDSSEHLNDDDIHLIELIKKTKSIAIINKSDLESKIDVDFLKRNIGEVVILSSLFGTGIDILEKKVENIIKISKTDPSEGIIATQRQANIVGVALNYVQEAYNAVLAGITFDAVAVLIESAIECILELTGERVNEVVVDEIFSKFCVGK